MPCTQKALKITKAYRIQFKLGSINNCAQNKEHSPSSSVEENNCLLQDRFQVCQSFNFAELTAQINISHNVFRTLDPIKSSIKGASRPPKANDL